MATTITINPVIPSGDGGYELLTQSIMAGQEVKRKREEAIQKAILEQRTANQKLFGDTQESLRTFYKDANNVPAEVRNTIFNQGIEQLKAAANTPDFQARAQEIANQAFQLNNTYGSFYKGIADASKELSEKEGMDQATMLSFANKALFEEQKDAQGNIVKRSLRDISNITDPVAFLRNEVMAHPELYINRAAMDTGAFKEMDELRKKDADISNELKLDPTGKKTVSLGYKYKLSPFETEEEKTDTVTGLKYKVPVLKEVKSTVTIPGTTNTYRELDPVKYDQFIGQAGPMTKKKLFIGAIDKIREHNAKAFEAAGYSAANAKEMALTVSKNNVNEWEKKGIPGFVNPFNTAEVQSFERIYAKDFLRLSKQYDESGQAREFALNRGVDVAAPKEKSGEDSESKKAANAGLDWMKSMDAALTSKNENTVKELLTSLYGGGSKKIISSDVSGGNAVIKYEGQKDTREFVQKNGKLVLNPDYGKSSIEQVTINISDPNAIKKMGGLYQNFMGSDKRVESYAVKKGTKLP